MAILGMSICVLFCVLLIAGSKKIKKHLKAWNYWRKGNLNSPLHKIAVLFGAYSPTFIGVKAGMDVAEEIEKYYRSGGE